MIRPLYWSADGWPSLTQSTGVRTSSASVTISAIEPTVYKTDGGIFRIPVAMKNKSVVLSAYNQTGKLLKKMVWQGESINIKKTMALAGGCYFISIALRQ
jgi:hypothetical protein